MKFQRIWLKKGTFLYHGTGTEEDFEMPIGPAWFSDLVSVALRFSTWHGEGRPRVLRYVVTRSVQVAIIRTDRDFQRFQDAVAEATGIETENDPRELAENTCQTNVPGWLIWNNYNPGHDILLCRPEDVLERVAFR
jgi:hypothetical protein